MHPSNTDAILLRVESLPTLAPVAARLLSLSSADDADFDEIIRLIEADPALTSRLLSLCRRASTGAAQPVSTVRRAVVLLGLEALQAAVLSVQVV
ncbi:MAG: HDOD domain-containing protein, partial [Phycisphaerales bacterium]|nr:HDOD domain-containing protein [Phycisphaerales bacterium]